jgi:hypothetical protein
VSTSSRRHRLAVVLTQHADQYRPKGPILLAVDRELGEGPRLGVPPVRADCVGPVEVRQREDVEQLGAGSGAEGVQALAKPAL